MLVTINKGIQCDQVRRVPLNGQMPSEASLACVRDKLLQCPDALRAIWRRRGGRVDIVPGDDAGLCPGFTRKAVRAGGLCRGVLIALAENDLHARLDGCPNVVLHELAHAYDNIYESSDLPEFQRIYQAEIADPEHSSFVGHHLSSARGIFRRKFRSVLRRRKMEAAYGE